MKVTSTRSRWCCNYPYRIKQLNKISPTTHADSEYNSELFFCPVAVYRYGYLIILILNTGMREGEPLYLKWKDVDFQKRRIFIHGNVTEVKNRDKNAKCKYIAIEQETPKTDKSNRYIPLNDNAVRALEELRSIIKDNDRVIATKNHTILSPRKVYHTMENILERCNITGKKNLVHALRHTFATSLIRNGVDIKAVSEILGHEDVATTVPILTSYLL